MKTRIINSSLGGITKALYISSTGNSTIYYNAGRAGIDYRFLEYGASYFPSDSSDFNILDYLSNKKLKELYGEEDRVPDYDELENIYNTAVPCGISEETSPEFRNYFGSFIASQRTIYVFIVPAGVQTIRLYDDSGTPNPSDEVENDGTRILVDFGREATWKEVVEEKVVYISISQADTTISGEIQVSVKSWLQLINPLRKKPGVLVSDTKLKVPRAVKRGEAWFDAASGVILGNKKVQSPILERKKEIAKNNEYSSWRTYESGDKAIFPKSKRYNYVIGNFDETLNLPAGHVCIYGNCNIADIIVAGQSIWWNYPTTIDEIRGDKVYRYISSAESSLVSREYCCKASDTIPAINPDPRPILLRKADRDYSRLEFYLSEPGIIRIVGVAGTNLSENICLIVEYPHIWTSLRDGNIGHTPSTISPYWSSDDDLTNYYTKITEIVCSHGSILPSGIINIPAEMDEITAKLILRPGWDVKKELESPSDTMIQEPGIRITQRMDSDEEYYYHVIINGEESGGWKRKYEINAIPINPDIFFKFPTFTSNSSEGVEYSDPIRITSFYKEPGNLDKGLTINLRNIISALSTSYPSEQVPLREFLETQKFSISPEFPKMLIDEETGIASVNEVTVYSGTYTFIPSNRNLYVLVANSYDFSVSNPYHYVEYGGIVSDISFKSETGATPGWIWIDKVLDDEEKVPVKCSLEGLDDTGRVIIDGTGYNFTKMIITKDGNEYNIKIEDIKNSIKIDIIEA